MTKEKLAIKLAIDIMERNVNKYINHGIYEVSDTDGAVHVEFGEAINILNGMLEQEPCEDVLDKIKAEIETDLSHFCFDDWGNENPTWKEVKAIIDKYKDKGVEE